MKTILTISLLLLTLVACRPQGTPLHNPVLVDLTHSFGEETIYWPTAEGFKLEEVSHGRTPLGFFYAANQFKAAEHGGTHLDSPIHFHEDGQTVEQIPLERLVGPGVVIDLSTHGIPDRDHQISVEDLLAFEKTHGQIPMGAIVLLRTGFGNYWPDAKRYLGTKDKGEAALKELHFPGLHPAAAQWLIGHRKIKAVGIDTASIDHGQTKEYPTHQILANRNVPIFENVANLDLLPDRGFTVVALPMKIAGGSGAPLRIIAILSLNN